MRVFVTGGSGFVGSAVVDQILSRGRTIHALTTNRPIDKPGVTSFAGGLFDGGALAAGVVGCDAVVHLVGIIAEKSGATFERIHVDGTRRVVAAATAAGVRRVVHMSALGARPGAVATYHRTKYAAEQIVRQSGVAWTIFRPSMILGPQGAFMKQATAWACGTAPPFFAMPYFGRGVLGRNGSALIQPVSVDDVAACIADCLTDDRTVGEVFPLGGPDRMTWPRMYEAIATAVTGKPAKTVAIPAWFAKALAGVISGLPFNRDQVVMSQEDNVCDVSKFVEFFGRRPRPLAEMLTR